MKSSNHFLYVAILSIVLTAPLTSHAAIVLTEIMYDPKDTDASAGGEWIEVHNTDSVAVDLTQWIFFEADTNHGIIAEATAEVPPDGYVVISRDLTAFKNYFMNFSGLLFKASFSLNDGEMLAMKAGREEPIADSVTYTSTWGAKNDGNSLQKINDTWVPQAPTPGASNSGSTPSSGSSSSSSPSYSSAPSSPAQTSTITARAGKDQTTFVGAGSIFEGEALGTQGSPLQNARYVWNFGDGIVAEGKSVMHTYLYPGTYIAVLSVASGEYSASDRLTVTVVSPEVSLAIEVDGSLVVRNASSQEIDLGVWMLTAGGAMFTIPRGTIVLSGGSVRFAPSVLGFSGATNAALLGPNGTVAAQTKQQNSVAPVPVVTGNTAKPLPATQSVKTSTATPRVSEDIVGEDLIAAPVSSNFSLPLWGYLVGLIALVGLGVVGSLYARLSKEQAGGTKSTADEFEISG